MSKESFWEKNRPWLIFVLVSFFAIILWYFSIEWVVKKIALEQFGFESSEITGYGEIGDMFGVINSIFSGIALAGVIITILLQKEELQKQREELIETRREFHVNRITNLIYKQLELFEGQIQKIEDSDELDDYNRLRGKDYIDYVVRRLERVGFETELHDIFVDFENQGQLLKEIRRYLFPMRAYTKILNKSIKLIELTFEENRTIKSLESNEKKKLRSIFLYNVSEDLSDEMYVTKLMFSRLKKVTVGIPDDKKDKLHPYIIQNADVVLEEVSLIEKFIKDCR